MRIAAAQVLTGPDPQANLEIVADYTARAAAAGARLVAFPEATMRAFGTGSLPEIAEDLEGPWASRVAEIAREHGIVVAAGMFHPAGDGARVVNSYLVTGVAEVDSGREVHTAYRKIHLYDAFGFRESDTVAAGTTPLVVEIDQVPVGFSVCYDIRFPDQYRLMARHGAQLLVCGASWGAGPQKVDHWRLLARARALDSTTPMLAVGQAYPEAEGRTSHDSAPQGVGHSMLVAADAAVLAEAGEAGELLVGDIDLAHTEKVRASLPVLRSGPIQDRD